MKPENHAIRDLERMLEGATPEQRAAIERVIAALSAVVMNSDVPEALEMAKRILAIEIDALAKIMKLQG